MSCNSPLSTNPTIIVNGLSANLVFHAVLAMYEERGKNKKRKKEKKIITSVNPKKKEKGNEKKESGKGIWLYKFHAIQGYS